MEEVTELLSESDNILRPEPIFYLGKIGCKAVETVNVDYVTAPDGTIGLPVDSLYKFIVELEPNNILWLRAANESEELKVPQPAISSFLNGRLQIDHARLELVVDDKSFQIPKKEMDIFMLLAENVGRIMSRERIVNECWGYEYDASISRSLDVHIRRIRKNLNPYQGALRTVRQRGYLFDERYELS